MLGLESLDRCHQGIEPFALSRSFSRAHETLDFGERAAMLALGA